ncbi:MAG: hypothetical protein AVDCRST_MAG77-1724, partial [uncultured Chloroflexi bacterium]
AHNGNHPSRHRARRRNLRGTRAGAVRQPQPALGSLRGSARHPRPSGRRCHRRPDRADPPPARVAGVARRGRQSCGPAHPSGLL